jgi:hypothetical protein
LLEFQAGERINHANVNRIKLQAVRKIASRHRTGSGQGDSENETETETTDLWNNRNSTGLVLDNLHTRPAGRCTFHSRMPNRDSSTPLPNDPAIPCRAFEAAKRSNVQRVGVIRQTLTGLLIHRDTLPLAALWVSSQLRRVQYGPSSWLLSLEQ